MSRRRVLVRAFTCRRDVAYSELLATVLRRLGYDVIVASVRSFAPTLTRWKPHCVVVNVPGQILPCRERAPWARIVFLDGEGGEPIETSNARYFAANVESFRAADRILVWGQAAREFFDQLLPGEDLDKVRVTGNPKLDLVKFLPEEARGRPQERTVGLIGRFSQLNHHLGVATLRSLLGGSLDEVVNAARDFHHLCDAVRSILEHTSARISIRPYPNEAIETYHRYVEPYFGPRVRVDDGLDFAEWAARQRLLLTSASSSILEAYLLRVPVVSLSAIAGTREYARERYPLAAELDALVTTPADHEELCRLVDDPPAPPTANPEIDAQLRRYHGWELGGSAVVRAAREIVDVLDGDLPATGAAWPRWLVDLRDAVSFHRARRENPLHANMNYRAGHHRLPRHLGAMAQAAIASDRTGAPAGATDPARAAGVASSDGAR